MALIELEQLAKTYIIGGVETPAIRGVSFSINAGEFVAIMGPSGSGKSTLLHILGFLDRPSSGVYRFDGKRMDEYNDDELAQIRNQQMGFVFQAFNLLPHLDVFQNVAMPLVYAGVRAWDRKKVVEEAVKNVDMTHRLHYAASLLSGGERQRVAIARALVNRPKVIFADEPTGNLDSASGGVVMDTLAKLNAAGHTVILVTHELYTAGYASRVIQVRDGQIEKEEIVAERHRVGEAFVK